MAWPASLADSQPMPCGTPLRVDAMPECNRTRHDADTSAGYLAMARMHGLTAREPA